MEMNGNPVDPLAIGTEIDRVGSCYIRGSFKERSFKGKALMVPTLLEFIKKRGRIKNDALSCFAS
jgi:hypothetical protein